MNKKLTGHVKSWTTNNYQDFSAVLDAIAKGRNDDAVSMMHQTNHDMSGMDGWTEVGVATVTIEFYPREQIVAKQVEGLREQLRQQRINAHNAEQALLDKISKLQALTMESA